MSKSANQAASGNGAIKRLCMPDALAAPCLSSIVSHESQQTRPTQEPKLHDGA